jgi:hypothetical protein
MSQMVATVFLIGQGIIAAKGLRIPVYANQDLTRTLSKRSPVSSDEAAKRQCMFYRRKLYVCRTT